MNKEQMKEEACLAMDEIPKRIEAFVKSDAYCAYINYEKDFTTYSYRNRSRVLMQNPNATHVATERVWNKKGRYVKKGEKPLSIIAPGGKNGYRTVKVFDIEQTEGKPAPELVKLLTSKVDGFEELRAAVASLFEACGVEIVEWDMGDDFTQGYMDYEWKQVVVKTGLGEAMYIKVLLHELTHYLLHQSGCMVERALKEWEAESVAYLVCHHFGIDTSDYTLGYLVSWGVYERNYMYMLVKDRVIRTAIKVIERITKALEEIRKGN